MFLVSLRGLLALELFLEVHLLLLMGVLVRLIMNDLI